MTSGRDKSKRTERERLAALRRHALLDTPPEAEFDRIVELVRIICQVPVALVSLVDADRQWFKAKAGTTLDQTRLDTSVCALAIRNGALFQIEDLSADPRTADMSLVTGEGHLRFYAGVPLVTSDGHALGSLCAIDTVTRPGGLMEHQRDALMLLAHQAVRLIELRAVLDADVARMREHTASRAIERADLVIRSARLGTFDYDLRSGDLVWDDRCRELFGLSTDAQVTYAEAFLRGVHPEDRDQADAAVQAALDPAGDGVFETDYRTIGIEDGLLRHVAARGQAYFGQGQAVRLVGTVQDVTAVRMDELALAEARQRLELAARATNDAIWDWDLVRDHVTWNAALRRAYGHRPEDVTPDGQWWLNQIHPEDRGRISDGIHGIIDGHDIDWTDEYRFRRADGSYADVLDRGYVLRDAGGRAVRMIGAMLDQSQNKGEARRLQTEASGLAQQVRSVRGERDRLWDTTSDLMGTAGLDGMLKTVNPAWGRLLGWSEEALMARSFFEIVNPLDHAGTTEAMSRLAKGERVTGFVNHVRDARDAYHTIMWDAVPDAGGVFFIIGRDLTEQRLMEERLRQSQKMEAVGQLTGGIAHDFNNMLTGVIGSLELLKRAAANGQIDRVDRYVEAATQAAQRAAALTHRLLAFSRRQALDTQPVDVSQVVGGMEELLRRTLGEQVLLETHLATEGWYALTDANQLESAILNLAINARDAMPGGGSLVIETGNVTLDAAEAAVLEEVTPGDYVTLSVSDTGAGMSADVVARAFDPFFTTKPIGQGTGLGLSMIYGFARQTGGCAQIRSEPGRGATVTLHLPRHAGALPQRVAEPGGDRPAQAGDCVMLVEDDAAVRAVMEEVLETLGYDLIVATDGREACRLLDQKPAIDLLITDVGLPGMNGRQVAEHARNRLPGLKVLFVTGYAEQAAARSEFLDEGMDIIAKPFVVDALSRRIREMLGR